MKRAATILIALMLVVGLLSLSACNSGPDTTNSPSPSGTSESVSDNQDGTEVPFTSEEGKLIMATSAGFPPYEFWEGGAIVGIDAEIAEAIAGKLGLTLQIDDMDFTSVILAVTSGKADIAMAGLTITEERMLSVNFTTSYATGVQAIIVKEGSEITSVYDLYAEDAFFNIGVQESTTGDLYTTWDLEDEGLATIFRFTKGADAVMALATDRVDCVVIDDEPAKAFVAQIDGLMILETEFTVEDYAIAVGIGNTALLEAIDNALTELINDGTVQSIIDKYINAD